MFSSLSMDHGGPANALGASLGRGLSSLTNGGRFGNDSTKHIVSSQGFGANVSVDELVTLLKSLISATSPRGQEHGGQDSVVTRNVKCNVSRVKISEMSSPPVSKDRG